ncbi:MAG: YfhO family protein, partial [Oscillospiraceae bacterium]
MKSKRKNIGLSLTSIFIPVFILILVFIQLGVKPFGEGTLFCIDLNGQYISYFAYFKELLKGERSWIYSFSKFMGGDMQGLLAYYLLSPFNFIFAFFEVEDMALAITFLTLLKIGAAGFAGFFYFSKMSEFKFSNLIFSTAYALMAYNIAYAQNIMWLDAVIILPIVAYGIEKILDGKNPITYILALFYGIFTCYYTGYMLCVFSVIYFLYRFFCKTNFHKNFDLEAAINKFFTFGCGSILSGGMSCVIFLPALISLRGSGKGVVNMANLINLTPNFRIREFASHALNPQFRWESLVDGMPNIFVGVVVLFIAGLFFLNFNISAKERLASLFVISFMLMSFYFEGLTIFWHGFIYPIWFPFRFSFVFSFFVIYLAFLFIQKIDIPKFEKIMPIFLVVIFVLNGVSLYGFSKSAFSQIIQTTDGFKPFVQTTKPLIDAIKEKEKDNLQFYRIEKDYWYSNNDPMTFSYNGMSHYSSGDDLITRQIARQMGYTTCEGWGRYNTPRQLSSDSFYGIKYILSKEKMPKTLSPAVTIGDITAYENPYALPLGFKSKNDILKVDKGLYSLLTMNDGIYSAITGKEVSLFTKQEKFDEKLSNITKSVEENKITYALNQGVNQGEIVYLFEAQQSGSLYVNFDGGNFPGVQISMNGRQAIDFISYENNGVAYLGDLEKGEKAEVKLIIRENLITYPPNFLFEDHEEFGEIAREIQ